MKNRQNLKQNNGLSPSEIITKTAAVKESAEFGFMFSSASNSKWFEMVMQHAGTYLFVFALILNIIKVIMATYRFYNQRNKNLSEKSGLLWGFVQLGLIGTAILGAVTAAAVFVLVTPILFVTAMATDTLRNVGMLLWNSFRLAALYFSVRGKLNDPLTKLKYEKLKDVYQENIKQTAIASLIGLLVTGGAAIVFLLPHVGAAAAAIAATAITIGALKTTFAGVAGLIAGAAMVAPLVVTPIVMGLKKLGSFLTRVFSKEQKEEKKIEEKKLLLEEEKPAADRDELKEKGPAAGQGELKGQEPEVQVNQPAQLMISNRDELKTAMKHKLNHNGLFNHSEFRELIIEHIDEQQPELAKGALIKMVGKKTKALRAQLDGTSWLDGRQTYKRQQKLEALVTIGQYLEGRKVLNDENLEVTNVDALIKYIDRSYPEVDHSFFRHESDTRNVLQALRAYEKFEKAVQGEEPVAAPVAQLS